MATRLGPGIPAALFVLLLFLPSTSQGTAVHAFDCKKCHTPSLSVSQLGGGNVCLSCHDETVSMPFNDDGTGYTTGTVATAFTLADASNALGNNSSPASLAQFSLGRGQTSHNWAASDTQPRAGAAAPDAAKYPQFYSRYGSSTGRVTCSRCHNPHATRTNPQLLILGAGSAQQMCLACHAPWNQQGTDKTNITHPVGIDYAAATTPHAGSYNSATLPEDDGDLHTNGSVSLFGGKIMCGSCHQAHFADSNAATIDTPENFENLSMGGGDGKLLRGNGAGRANNSSLCQTCHIYQSHGNDTGEQVGCMVCHGGHANDPLAPNYFMLRKSATTVTYNTVDGLEYSSATVLDPLQKSTWWNDGADGMEEGYCEKCHGDAAGIGSGAGSYHVAAAICTDCHLHGAVNGAFAASCDACHGMPPVANTSTTPGGLVNKPGTTGSNTAGAHAAHAVTKQYPCGSCHANSAGSGPTHNDGAPQSVSIGFSLFDDAYRGGGYNGQAGVSYDSSQTDTAVSNNGANTCANLYCHGNYPGSGKNAAPRWDDAGTAACGSCHGGSNSDYPGSGSHRTHAIATGYNISCTACHSGTVSGTDPYSLTGQAKHANGKIDWAFDSLDSRLRGGAERYNIATGTAPPSDGTTPRGYSSCENIYCHSNAQPDGGIGKPDSYAKPVWGSGTDLGCGSCHPGGIHGDTGPIIASGSHAAHLSGNTSGVLKCMTCHRYDTTLSGSENNCRNCHVPHQPADSGLYTPYVFANHVDGKVTINFDPTLGASGSYDGTPEPGDGYGRCSNISCHGSGSPQWGGTVACGECHALPPATGAHLAHTNGTGAAYGSDSNLSTVASQGFNCGNCHAMDGSKHSNGVVEIELYNAAATGFKQNNPANAGRSGTGNATICQNTYCHSSGQDAGVRDYAATPVWGGTFSGNRCAGCHGDPPAYPNGGTGSANANSHYASQLSWDRPVEGGHLVGLHFDNIRKDPPNELAPLFLRGGSAGSGAGHGDPATSTTISCPTCHAGTVTVAGQFSAPGTIFSCQSCHANPVVGSIADKSRHVNGSRDVQFMTGTFRTRAQLQPDPPPWPEPLPGPFTSVIEPLGWTRNNGYKTATDSHDSVPFSGDYNAADKSCTTVCHLSQPATWGDTSKGCFACHADL